MAHFGQGRSSEVDLQEILGWPDQVVTGPNGEDVAEASGQLQSGQEAFQRPISPNLGFPVNRRPPTDRVENITQSGGTLLKVVARRRQAGFVSQLQLPHITWCAVGSHLQTD